MDKRLRQIPSIPPTQLRKKRVSAYARVSDGKDAMLHSLSAQVSYYSALIQSHVDWEYAGVFADEALTGTKDTRAELQKLLQKCRAGEVDMIITKSISRLARNTVHLLKIVRELKMLGVDVFFEEQNIHSLTSEGELMLALLASFAQEESRMASENCKWRIRNSYARGEVMNWRFLYGYRITRQGVTIHEAEAETVKRIFRDYLDGVGATAIARSLREEGVPCNRGGTWTPNRVIELLKNEKYAGNALLQKKFVVDHLGKRLMLNHGQLPMHYAEGTHHGIISEEVFDQATALRVANHRKNGGRFNVSQQHALTGLIVCGHCGKHYRRKMNNGKPCWICGTYLTFGRSGCPSKYIPEQVLKEKLRFALGADAFTEGDLRRSIYQIRVPAPHRLVFGFVDGRTIEIQWDHRSRKESWTEEMREQARAHARRRYEHE